MAGFESFDQNCGICCFTGALLLEKCGLKEPLRKATNKDEVQKEALEFDY